MSLGHFTHQPEPRKKVLRQLEVCSYPVSICGLILDIDLLAFVSRHAETQSAMRVEAKSTYNVLRIVRVAYIDARTIKGTHGIIEFSLRDTAPDLQTDIPFLDEFGIAVFPIVEARVPSEFEVQIGPAGERQETPARLRFDAQAAPLL